MSSTERAKVHFALAPFVDSHRIEAAVDAVFHALKKPELPGRQSTVMLHLLRPTMEDHIRMMTCRSQCDRSDLERFRGGNIIYTGKLDVGDVFEWEPDKPHAAETVEIVRIHQRPNDEDWIVTRGSKGGEYGNDESRFREAVVKSLMRFCP